MNVWIYGAGAQGRITLDILRASNPSDQIAFVDDNAEAAGKEIEGAKVFGSQVLRSGGESQVIIAVGKPSTRLALAKRLSEQGVTFRNAIHPKAIVLPSAKLGVGNIVSPGTVIDTAVTMGDHNILNPNVLVGHDSTIASGVTLAGGVNLGSRVTVGDGAFLCMGCCIVPRVVVGEGAVVGAGSLVLKDIPARVLASGAPARPVWPVDANFDWSKVL